MMKRRERLIKQIKIMIKLTIFDKKKEEIAKKIN